MLKRGDIVVKVSSGGWNKIGDIAIVIKDEYIGGVNVKYEHDNSVVFADASSFRKIEIDFEWLMKQVEGE